MDPEIAFNELGQDGKESTTLSLSAPPSFFQTNLEQRIGMIGSGIIMALSLVVIAYLVIKNRRKDQHRESSSLGSTFVGSGGGGMFDKNVELMTRFPYSQLSNDE